MAKRTVVDCDRCGKQSCHPASTFHLTVGSQRDACGSTEEVQEEVDLCHPCLEICMGIVLANLNEKDAKLWVSTNKKVRYINCTFSPVPSVK